MSSLSICLSLPLLPAAACTPDKMKQVIHSYQVPLYLRLPDSRGSETWKNCDTHDMRSTLGPERVLQVLTSPTRMFGFYQTDKTQITRRGDRLWAKDIDEVVMYDAEFEVPHVQYEGDVESVLTHLDGATQSDDATWKQHYFRSVSDFADMPNVRSCLPANLPPDEVEWQQLGLYFSQAGFITNLHLDKYSGVIQQLRGRKRVYMFPPREVPRFKLYPRGHTLERRSQFNGKIDNQLIEANPALAAARGYEVVLNPDEYIYIPAGWLHYVETLDDDTVSLIVRFKK